MLMLCSFYDNLCQHHRQTDRQIYQKYSSESNKILNWKLYTCLSCLYSRSLGCSTITTCKSLLLLLCLELKLSKLSFLVQRFTIFSFFFNSFPNLQIRKSWFHLKHHKLIQVKEILKRNSTRSKIYRNLYIDFSSLQIVL